MSSYIRRKLAHYKENFTLAEISGSLGDLGTLVPLMVSLSLSGQVSLTSSLIFGGLWNIITGLKFGIPMCVQPMKTIGAIALASKMSMGEIMGAGMFVSGVVLFLGLTRTIHLVNKYTPHAVVRGIQMGTGITLMTKAGTDLLFKIETPWGGTNWKWHDNYEWAIVWFCVVFFLYHQRRIPTAMIIFVIGLVFAIIVVYTSSASIQLPSPGFYYPKPVVPTPGEFVTGMLNAGLGQLPLTTLNSVIALVALIKELFPENQTTTSSVATCVGLMNLTGCFFGSMPFCHGSGGLAGQYRFGARSEVSILFLGICKMLIGFILGGSFLGLLQYFPKSFLGVMLFVSGLELAMAARNFSKPGDSQATRNRNFLIVLVSGGMLMTFKNDGVGFVSGIVAYICLWLDARRRGVEFEHSGSTVETKTDQGNTNEQCVVAMPGGEHTTTGKEIQCQTLKQ
ncbi:sulfate transporter [Basidiobolus meristosporus CBS 931.73]|uniref:Sulfate transporter n=1 Tax=Basidiobolus meristosporus CBS 931.73 TaxID=1314790 RepID=A0A1Y1X1H6_9FUNG|nr:sulfate transporter [Basidiobolus meristosporus CBS 931.73]|eukprot:ORX79649.1 sulfate transporter [Basidiobolus meristosporus CBS 931.73]